MIHPFKAVKAWSERHRELCKTFVIEFIATVMGIVLTFGTTMWYERQQKAEAANALVERCLSNMESRLKNLDAIVENYDKKDRLYGMATNLSLDSLSNEDMYQLIDAFTWPNRLIVNHAYEESFKQSVNSHEILGSFANVIAIGFEDLRVAEENHEEVNNLKQELRREQIVEHQASWDQNNMREYVKTVLIDPEFVYMQQECQQHERFVRMLHDYLQLFIPEARRLWNKELAEEDFWKEVNEQWGK